MSGARIAHAAVWARGEEGLERLRDFYERHFGARAGRRYESANRPGFVSYFLAFPGDDGAVWLELMTAPDLVAPSDGDAVGYAHLALSLGSRAAVDEAAARLVDAGVPLVSAPRVTGDGYYEAVVRDPEGNLLELTE